MPIYVGQTINPTKELATLKTLVGRKMTPYELYLSQAVDLADLENRMKHGYNRDFAPFYDDVRATNLFLVRGF